MIRDDNKRTKDCEHLQFMGTWHDLNRCWLLARVSTTNENSHNHKPNEVAYKHNTPIIWQCIWHDYSTSYAHYTPLTWTMACKNLLHQKPMTPHQILMRIPILCLCSLRPASADALLTLAQLYAYIFGRWRATPKHSCQSCYPPRDLSPSLRGCPLPFAIARARIPPHKANPWLFVDGTCGRRTKGWMKDLESESV